MSAVSAQLSHCHELRTPRVQGEHNVLYLTKEAAEKMDSHLQLHLAAEDGHAAPHSLRTWLQYAPDRTLLLMPRVGRSS